MVGALYSSRSSRAVVSVLLIGCGVTVGGSTTTWHLIDVPKLVCQPHGTFEVAFPLADLKLPTRPHILTFLRSSFREVTVNFTLTDSATPNVTVATDVVKLQPVVAARKVRRLRGSWRRRRRGASSYYSRRRGSAYGEFRRRYSQRQSYDSRRRSPQGTAWTNRRNPGGGSYVYPNGAMNQNFGGRPPTQTKYGYSGASSYGRSGNGKSGNGGNMAIAFGGGLLAGGAASYMLSRWHGMHQGGCIAGAQRIHPDIPLARDDLMNLVFIPAKFNSTLRLGIAAVIGEAFNSAHLCPPPGWSQACPTQINASVASNCNVSWKPPMHADLLVALTPVSRLDAAAAAVSGHESYSLAHGRMAAAISTLLLLCCCLCVCFAIVRAASDALDLSGSESTPTPQAAYPYPQQYPPYPQQYRPYPQQYPPQVQQQHFEPSSQAGFYPGGQISWQVQPGYHPGCLPVQGQPVQGQIVHGY